MSVHPGPQIVMMERLAQPRTIDFGVDADANAAAR